MISTYERDSRTIEIGEKREPRDDREISSLTRRMVRETELFLSYALANGPIPRWLMRGKASAAARP